MPVAIIGAMRHWKLVAGGLALAGLAVMLLLAKADARHWRKRAEHCQLQAEVDARKAAEATAANATRAASAADAFAERTAAVQPLVIRSTDTVREYAQTDAGRARCLDANRVRGVDALDAALRGPRAPAGGADPVQPDPGAPPG